MFSLFANRLPVICGRIPKLPLYHVHTGCQLTTLHCHQQPSGWRHLSGGDQGGRYHLNNIQFQTNLLSSQTITPELAWPDTPHDDVCGWGWVRGWGWGWGGGGWVRSDMVHCAHPRSIHHYRKICIDIHTWPQPLRHGEARRYEDVL